MENYSRHIMIDQPTKIESLCNKINILSVDEKPKIEINKFNKIKKDLKK